MELLSGFVSIVKTEGMKGLLSWHDRLWKLGNTMSPSLQKDTAELDNMQQRTTKVMRKLEHLPYEERHLGLFCFGKTPTKHKIFVKSCAGWGELTKRTISLFSQILELKGNEADWQ